jgi:hypothetical protein
MTELLNLDIYNAAQHDAGKKLYFPTKFIHNGYENKALAYLYF